MKARTKNRRRTAPQPGRSPKAGKPPQDVATSPQARRRRKTATAAFKKDTMLSQAAEGPRVWWAAGKPKEKKR